MIGLQLQCKAAILFATGCAKPKWTTSHLIQVLLYLRVTAKNSNFPCQYKIKSSYCDQYVYYIDRMSSSLHQSDSVIRHDPYLLLTPSQPQTKGGAYRSQQERIVSSSRAPLQSRPHQTRQRGPGRGGSKETYACDRTEIVVVDLTVNERVRCRTFPERHDHGSDAFSQTGGGLVGIQASSPLVSSSSSSSCCCSRTALC